MNHRRFLPLLYSFLLLGCGPPKDQAVLGSVLQLEGSGSISPKADRSKTRVLRRDDRLAPGDELRLQSESIAVLCLTPGIYIRGFSGTSLRIDALSIAKDGDETGNAMHMRRAAIHLEEGQLHILLPAAGSSRADLKLHTRFGMLNAKVGTLFSVVLHGDTLRVLCARGQVNWSEPPAASTTIGAGYLSSRRSGGSGAADPSSAADDPIAQAEIMALLDSAQAIGDLESAARNALAPWRRQ